MDPKMNKPFTATERKNDKSSIQAAALAGALRHQFSHALPMPLVGMVDVKTILHKAITEALCILYAANLPTVLDLEYDGRAAAGIQRSADRTHFEFKTMADAAEYLLHGNVEELAKELKALAARDRAEAQPDTDTRKDVSDMLKEMGIKEQPDDEAHGKDDAAEPEE